MHLISFQGARMRYYEQDTSQVALHSMGTPSLCGCRHPDPFRPYSTKAKPHWLHRAVDLGALSTDR